ncbi:hypothetical protein C9426_27980 [Serratia sp. S1B]|nr:hypothetical protein C9426_27980 [Serratia sp. S1B]
MHGDAIPNIKRPYLPTFILYPSYFKLHVCWLSCKTNYLGYSCRLATTQPKYLKPDITKRY